MNVNQQTINPKVSPVCTLMALALVVAFGCFAQARAQWTTPDANQNISNTNSGNVGVKTTTPEFPLQVNASSSNVLGMVYTGTLSLTSGAGIQSLNLTTPTAADQRLGFYTFGVRNGGTSYNPVAIQGYSSQAWTLNSAQGGYLTFATTPNGSITRTERMRIDQNGKVGIGITAPTAYLHIMMPSADWEAIRIHRNANFAAWGVAQVFALNNSSGATTDYAQLSGGIVSNTAGSENGFMAFFTRASGTMVERMRLLNDGNLGIGNATPAYKLDVSGSINATTGLCIAGDCKASWSAVGGSQWSNATGGINYAGGNVGIGVTNPSQKLEVNGGALISTVYGSSAAGGVLSLQSTSSTTKGTVQIGYDQTTTTYIGQSGTTGNKLIAGTDRLIVNNAGVRINGATDYTDLSVTKVNITNPDALQFRNSSPNITSDGSLRFTVQNVGGDNVKFTVQNNVVSNAFVVDSASATPAKLFDLRDMGVTKFSVSGTGNVFVAGNIAAKYQDIAEWVESSQDLPAGTVVVLDQTKSNQVIASTHAYDSSVAGVISLQPGLTLGEGGDGHVLVATTGRVKVKVDATNGPIQIGDLLVTSDKAGFAMKSVPVDVSGIRMHRPGTLIGKALEPLAQGTGEILVLLSLQ